MKQKNIENEIKKIKNKNMKNFLNYLIDITKEHKKINDYNVSIDYESDCDSCRTKKITIEVFY